MPYRLPLLIYDLPRFPTLAAISVIWSFPCTYVCGWISGPAWVTDSTTAANGRSPFRPLGLRYSCHTPAVFLALLPLAISVYPACSSSYHTSRIRLGLDQLSTFDFRFRTKRGGSSSFPTHGIVSNVKAQSSNLNLKLKLHLYYS
jgi:hypothetical protein